MTILFMSMHLNFHSLLLQLNARCLGVDWDGIGLWLVGGIYNYVGRVGVGLCLVFPRLGQSLARQEL